jgi:hypothetical protein
MANDGEAPPQAAVGGDESVTPHDENSAIAQVPSRAEPWPPDDRADPFMLGLD